MNQDNKILQRKLQRETRARLEAEMLLEKKSEELYDTLLAVQNSENLFKSALSSIKEGLLLTNRLHQVLLCNEQIKKTYLDWAYIFSPGINISDLFEPYMKHPTFIKMLAENSDNCSFEINLFDGKIIAVNVRINEQGVIASTHEDITHLRAVTTEQQSLLMKLLNAQKMEAIGKMSGTIAHDFNNIIAAIKGYASFLDEDIPDDPNLRNSVEKIISAAQKAEKLVQQILNYRHQQKPNYQTVDIVQLLKDCINLNTATLEENITITHQNHSKELLVEGNDAQINQVIMNLISNARDAIVSDQGRITVSCHVVESVDLNQINHQIYQYMPKDCYSIIAGLHIFLQPCVKIIIADNGIGMPEHVLKNTFELFFSTKQEQKGNGFGMYSVANIITEHAGGVKIYTKPQHGTICEIVIPVKKSIAKKPQGQYPKHTQKPKTEPLVMLIDDDEEVGLMLHQIFIRNKIKASYFDSAQRALNEIIRHPNKWALIICDQMMPEFTGTDLLKTIRDQQISIPFILHTAHIEDESTNPHLSLTDDIIKKPMNHNDIVKVVLSHLSND